MVSVRLIFGVLQLAYEIISLCIELHRVLGICNRIFDSLDVCRAIFFGLEISNTISQYSEVIFHICANVILILLDELRQLVQLVINRNQIYAEVFTQINQLEVVEDDPVTTRSVLHAELHVACLVKHNVQRHGVVGQFIVFSSVSEVVVGTLHVSWNVLAAAFCGLDICSPSFFVQNEQSLVCCIFINEWSDLLLFLVTYHCIEEGFSVCLVVVVALENLSSELIYTCRQSLVCLRHRERFLEHLCATRLDRLAAFYCVARLVGHVAFSVCLHDGASPRRCSINRCPAVEATVKASVGDKCSQVITLIQCCWEEVCHNLCKSTWKTVDSFLRVFLFVVCVVPQAHLIRKWATYRCLECCAFEVKHTLIGLLQE